MKQDIILCGVGGQGILSIATVIAQAATDASLNIKQAEVHGMSQRGGDVHSHLRLSEETVWSDLIPAGEADMILSMEPMEALRYVPSLAEGGVIVTAGNPFVNIPNYPDKDSIISKLKSSAKVEISDIEALAKEASAPRGANMVLLGMAAKHLRILSANSLREAIGKVFAAKGEAVVDSNIAAFEKGYNSTTN